MRPEFANGPRDISALKMLRISVTDRCNLRCVYCMPEEGMVFQEPDALLDVSQFEAIARVAVDLGVRHIKITGGEPTLRRDLIHIVEKISRLDIDDLSLTTNGLQLPRLAQPLREAGVDRVTLSVDSLRPDTYRRLTRGGRLDVFMRGLDAAAETFDHVKLNVVVIPGVNDQEVADLAALTLHNDWTVRFIEYMPLGESGLSELPEARTVLSAREIAARITAVHGPLTPVRRASEVGVGPAQIFTLPSSRGRIGFIHAMSQPFCESCNRLRLTAEGVLRSCLFDGGEIALQRMLNPIDSRAIRQAFHDCISLKPRVHARRGNRAMSQLGG